MYGIPLNTTLLETLRLNFTDTFNRLMNKSLIDFNKEFAEMDLLSNTCMYTRRDTQNLYSYYLKENLSNSEYDILEKIIISEVNNGYDQIKKKNLNNNAFRLVPTNQFESKELVEIFDDLYKEERRRILKSKFKESNSIKKQKV